MSPTRSPLLAISLALSLLAAGVGAGVALDRIWLRPSAVEKRPHRGPPSPERLLQRFRKELRLSDAQADAVLAILRDVHQEMRALRQRERPARKAARERGQTRILELLSPEQATRYKQLIAEHEQRMEKRWRHRERNRQRPGDDPPGPR